MSNDETIQIRPELDRAQLEARLASHPDHLKDAVESLAICVKAVMDSFGVYDITVRQSLIERPDGQKPGYVFEQLDQAGRSLKRTVLVTASPLATLDEAKN